MVPAHHAEPTADVDTRNMKQDARAWMEWPVVMVVSVRKDAEAVYTHWNDPTGEDFLAMADEVLAEDDLPEWPDLGAILDPLML
jgi:hypothetical protein